MVNIVKLSLKRKDGVEREHRKLRDMHLTQIKKRNSRYLGSGLNQFQVSILNLKKKNYYGKPTLTLKTVNQCTTLLTLLSN